MIKIKYIINMSKNEKDDNNIINSLIKQNNKKSFKKNIKNNGEYKNKIKTILYINNILSINFMLFISFFNISFSKNNIRKLNLNNQITIIGEGNGESIAIIGADIVNPNEVIINDVKQQNIGTNYKLTESKNTIIFSWNAPLNSCRNMFYNMAYIEYVDLSDFDSSQVATMEGMFYGCSNLKSINLKNLNTSSLISMEKMFQSCISLISLDLSNFKTSLVRNMRDIFNGCTSLVSVNLSNLNTRSLATMESMFKNDESLISLDLSSFNISAVEVIRDTFIGCKSLVYVNLISFIEREYVTVNNIFSDESNNSIYCIDESKSPRIYSCIQSKNGNNDCNNACFSENKKIIVEKKKCIDECKNDDIYIYEYNNICYDSKQITTDSITEYNENSIINDITDYTENVEKSENTEISETVVKTDIEITNKIEENENTDKTDNYGDTTIIDDKNKETYNTENYEDENTNEIESIKTDEKDNKEYNENSEKVQKTEDIKEIEDLKTTENDEKSKINENTDKFISTDIKENNSEIIEQLFAEKFFKQEKINEKTFEIDEIIKKIQTDLIKGNIDSLLQNVTNGTKQDLIASDKDIIYQITTTENQKNNNYSNISTINLGECENKLKEIYHIDNNLSLIILKIDYFMPGLLIPVIGYEVYDPINKTQLDLNYCKDITIKLNIPVSINESNIFKHDPNSEYYNDECNRYTTDNGTDILINDRQNEYIENNLSLCENNCTFKGYDKDTKKALCECETKPKIGLISEIILDENILSNNFNNTNNITSNIVTMKCVDTLFSKDGLLTNIGSYLLLFTFIFFAISIVIFYKCGYHIIESEIQEIINLDRKAKKINKLKNKINKINIYNNEDKNRIKKSKKTVVNPIKKKFKNNNTINHKQKKINSHISSSKLELKSLNITLNYKKKHKKINENKKIKININKGDNKIMKYKDCELNYFDYKKVLIYDKRTFWQYYISLLLSKHIILFSFFSKNDYNIKIIKISLFFLSFDIYFVINTLFFNISTIHQVYADNGLYDISYFIPKIIYSFIIAYFLMIAIRYLTLSDRYIIEIKNEKNKKIIGDKIYSIKRRLIIKYILFYVLCFIFLTIFWFYLASFCAVFQNSQYYVMINTFISFGISIIYPVIYNLLPSILRIISLKNKSNNIFIYKVSKILQLI